MEEGENRTGEPVQVLACRERPAEEQPLLSAVSNDSRDNRCRPHGSGSVEHYSVCYEAAIGFGYLILILVALPVGLFFGGVSFFRFDDEHHFIAPFWWSPFKILCFFLYSHLACRNKRRWTWTISTTFSKLIRNDWFASNIYLLVLGVVEPFCSLSGSAKITYFFVPIALYNSINKSSRVTFSTSVCAWFALTSRAMLLLCFILHLIQGSLQNVKLTAIRTAAITLTLIVSFRTSMHIIRKLIKPRQSLFEGLGEQWVFQWHRNPRKNQNVFIFFPSWSFIDDYQVIGSFLFYNS